MGRVLSFRTNVEDDIPLDPHTARARGSRPTTVNQILDFLAAAVQRVLGGDRGGADWVWDRSMTAQDRLAFDLFLVRMGDELAYQAGTPESRFRARVHRMAELEKARRSGRPILPNPRARNPRARGVRYVCDCGDGVKRTERQALAHAEKPEWKGPGGRYFRHDQSPEGACGVCGQGEDVCAFEHGCSCWRGIPCAPGAAPGRNEPVEKTIDRLRARLRRTRRPGARGKLARRIGSLRFAQLQAGRRNPRDYSRARTLRERVPACCADKTCGHTCPPGGGDPCFYCSGRGDCGQGKIKPSALQYYYDNPRRRPARGRGGRVLIYPEGRVVGTWYGRHRNGGSYKHRFTHRAAAIYGNPDGSITIRAHRGRLWAMFR